jgi:ribosomal-protein-alanine N-acetyltransferase
MDLQLRPWSLSDAVDLRRAVASSPDLVLQLGDADLSSETACASFIERALVPVHEDRVDRAICIDTTVVGNVGLSAIEHRHDSAWMSYWVAAGFRGRGLATRALAALAAQAFDELRLFRLELGHRTDNVASCHVADRAGFVAEGVERSKLRYGDLRFDVETHARLATDPAPAVWGVIAPRLPYEPARDSPPAAG